MDEQKLQKKLEAHKLWLCSDGVKGERFVAANKDCIETVFRNADLRHAIFERANLCHTDFQGASLQGADFRYANLQGVDFLSTNLQDADFRYANLQNVGFMGTSLYNARLQEAKNIPNSLQACLMVCPEEGSFIGWKKCNYHIIKLLIPEDAKRSSATTRKCRCSKAKVLDIQFINPLVPCDVLAYEHCVYGHKTVYEIGKEVYPDSFDENRWNECSHGIHFFITRQEAVDYW